MGKERILITVKTYPTLSKKYGELVCTAGMREDGSWIRIYPVPFRSMTEYKKFKKYQLVEANVIRNTRDVRPESHKLDLQTLTPIGEPLTTKDDWSQRRNWVLGKGDVHDDLDQLIAAARERNELSLATFKPTEIIDFIVEPQAAEWDKDKVLKLQNDARQGELFPDFQPVSVTKALKPLPWKFSYKFLDSKGRTPTLMIEDWEIGALYWNCLKDDATPEEAVRKVRQMYFEKFTTLDLHLFLGTTHRWHSVGPNPFVIIGVFYPPHQNQLELFDF